MDPKPSPGRFRGLSAHAIALTALFVALGAGAYAASLARNSVGPAQIKANAVGPSEMASDAVGSDEMQKDAIKAQELADKAVGEQQLKAQAVTADKLADQSVGLQQLNLQQHVQATQQSLQQLSNVIKAQQISANAIVSNLIDDHTIQPEDLSPAATTTLYTDNDETGLSITADTQIASLSLPAGTYMVFGSVEAVHTGAAAHTRLECYTTGDAGLVDFAKERLQPNVNATDSLIFTKQTLMGPATLASNGTINYRCTTTGAASTIALGPIHFQALRVASVVAQ